MYTYRSFHAFLKYFNTYIPTLNIKVIDATEGGARIKGTEIMELSDAIDEYLTDPYDAYELLSDIHNQFTPPEKDDLLEKFEVNITKYKEISRTCKKGIDECNKATRLIKKKKLADQAVLEEQSKALASIQRKQTAKVDETAKKNVVIEQYRGEMEKMVIQAKAEAERIQRSSEAYFKEKTVGADAEFYKMKQQAEATLAKKRAEAQGIEALKKALEGEGGRNMVKMEYAKKLKNLRIYGQPYTVNSATARFEHTAPASSVGKTQAKPGR